MFAVLLQYIEEHGNQNDYSENPKLWRWAQKQRKLKELNQLDKDRDHRLTEAGFIRSWREHKWKMMYEKLVRYKETHKDCRVPATYPSVN